MEDFNKFIEGLIISQKVKFEEAISNMVNAKEYVKKHTHINYCEVIIDKEGLIAEAHPSHTEFLRMYSGISNEYLEELSVKHRMDTPLSLLLKHTGCVAVWFGNYMYEGELSDKQVDALNTLIDAKVVNFELKKKG